MIVVRHVPRSVMGCEHLRGPGGNGRRPGKRCFGWFGACKVLDMVPQTLTGVLARKDLAAALGRALQVCTGDSRLGLQDTSHKDTGDKGFECTHFLGSLLVLSVVADGGGRSDIDSDSTRGSLLDTQIIPSGVDGLGDTSRGLNFLLIY
jgi:hypothetical protein